MLELNQVPIPDNLYLTKKLEPKTVQTVLGSNSDTFTVNRLFEIVNDKKSMIDLIDQTDDCYKYKMYVKISYAYAGDARSQVSNLKPWRQLIRKKPSWTLRAYVENLSFIKVYKFEHKFTNVNHLHEAIHQELLHLRKLAETKTQ